MPSSGSGGLRVVNTQTAWVQNAETSMRKRASSERVLNKVFSGAKQQVETGHQPLPDATTLNRNSDKLQPTVATNTIHVLDPHPLRSPPRGQAALEAAILLPSYMVFSRYTPHTIVYIPTLWKTPLHISQPSRSIPNVPTGNELGPSAPRYSQSHQHYCHNSFTPTMYNTQFRPLHPQQACPLTPQSSHYFSQDPPLGLIRTTPPTHTWLSPKNTTEATSDIEVSNDPNTMTTPHDWQSVNRTKRRRRRELSHPNEGAAQASSMPLSKIFPFSTNTLTLTPAN